MISSLAFAWEFARGGGVLWREDTGQFDRLWLNDDGDVCATTLTTPQTRKLVTTWVGKMAVRLALADSGLQRILGQFPEEIRLVQTMTVLPGGPEGIPRMAAKIMKALPDVSKRGEPGANKFEAFLRNWVDDHHRDGLLSGRRVGRHEGLSSDLLTSIFKQGNPNEIRSDKSLSVDLKAAMRVVFPSCPYTKHLTSPAGRKVRGYVGVRLRVVLPDGFKHKHAPDASHPPDAL